MIAKGYALIGGWQDAAAPMHRATARSSWPALQNHEPWQIFAFATQSISHPGPHAGTTELAAREIRVGNELTPLGASSKKDWLHGVLYPGAPPLAGDGALDELTLRLPARQTSYLGVEMHWLLAFMVFSLLAGLFLKDVLRVSI